MIPTTRFGPICRAIFRLICRQLEFTNDNDFSLRDLVLQEYEISCYKNTRSRKLKALSIVHSTCLQISPKMAL